MPLLRFHPAADFRADKVPALLRFASRGLYRRDLTQLPCPQPTRAAPADCTRMFHDDERERTRRLTSTSHRAPVRGADSRELGRQNKNTAAPVADGPPSFQKKRGISNAFRAFLAFCFLVKSVRSTIYRSQVCFLPCHSLRLFRKLQREKKGGCE